MTTAIQLILLKLIVKQNKIILKYYIHVNNLYKSKYIVGNKFKLKM